MMMMKFHELVGHYHHSTKASDALREHQQKHNVADTKLVQEVCTRWSSTWKMLDSVISNRLPITDHLLSQEQEHLLPTSREWDLAFNLRELLYPFKIATEEIQLEQNVSSSYVPKIANRLLHLVETFHSSLPEICQFRDALRTSMTERLFPVPKILMYAACLDPRFKQLDFLQSETLTRSRSSTSTSRLSPSTTSSSLRKTIYESVQHLMEAIPLSGQQSELQPTSKKRDPQAERAILWGDSKLTSQQKKNIKRDGSVSLQYPRIRSVLFATHLVENEQKTLSTAGNFGKEISLDPSHFGTFRTNFLSGWPGSF